MYSIFDSKVKHGTLAIEREEHFNSVYMLYYNELYRFAYHYVMCPHAEDIVQDVFLKLYEKSYTIKDSSHLKSYLYSAVKNRCIDYMRKLKIEDAKRQKLIEVFVYCEDPLGDTEEFDTVEKLNQLINILPEQQQKILQLKAEGKEYHEIAEILNISSGTVNIHVSRAYKTLRGKVYLTIFISL